MSETTGRVGSIADAVVVIPGAAHGIGAAYARALATEVAAVVVDLDREVRTSWRASCGRGG